MFSVKVRKRAAILIVAAAIVAALAVVYYFFSPEESGFFPRCPFYWLTGYKCPGCGSQRAIHALLHGDFCGAMGYNALMVVSIPIVALYCYVELARVRHSRLYAAVCAPAVIWIVLAVVVAWWIFRNVLGW